MQPLNSPLEIGLRAVILLTESFPSAWDIDRLLLMDYCLLHSADFGGPESIQPAISTRNGELGAKRSLLDHGLQLMARASLIEIISSQDGITYRASEDASPFLKLIHSSMVDRLSKVTTWVIDHYAEFSTELLRERTQEVANQWLIDWDDDRLSGINSEAFIYSFEDNNL